MEDFIFPFPCSKKYKQRKGASLHSADRLLRDGAAPLAFPARARVKRVLHISPLKALQRQEEAAAPGEALVEDLHSK